MSSPADKPRKRTTVLLPPPDGSTAPWSTLVLYADRHEHQDGALVVFDGTTKVGTFPEAFGAFDNDAQVGR